MLCFPPTDSMDTVDYIKEQKKYWSDCTGAAHICHKCSFPVFRSINIDINLTWNKKFYLLPYAKSEEPDQHA